MRTGYLECTIETGASQGQTSSNIPNAFSEGFGSFDARDFGPFGLVNADLVKDRGEFVPVFGHIDILGVRSEDVDTIFLEAQCDVLWQLAYPIMVGNALSQKMRISPPTLTTIPSAPSNSKMSITRSHPSSSKYSLSASSKSVETVSGL